MKVHFFGICAACSLSLLSWANEPAATTTMIQMTGARYRLLLNCQPCQVRGALNADRLQDFAALGGNCVLMPDMAGADALLEQAQQAGLMGAANIDLDRMGLTNYNDVGSFRPIFEQIQAHVARLKTKPGLMLWVVSSRIRTTKKDDDTAYRVVNGVARLIHEADPDHIVVSDVGTLDEQGVKARLSAQYGQEIDVLGCMMGPTFTNLSESLSGTGWHKPFLLIGLPASDSAMDRQTPWGAPLDPLPSESGAWLANYLTNTLAHAGGTCIGAIWFDGKASAETADALAFAWTGKYPANRCPVITAITSPVNARLTMPGAIESAEVKVMEPENEPLTYVWSLKKETRTSGADGRNLSQFENVDGAIQDPAQPMVSFSVPLEAGPYRLFVDVSDGHGHTTGANVPFLVQAVRAPIAKTSTDQPTPAPTPVATAPEGEDAGAAVIGKPLQVTIEPTGVGGGWQLKVDGQPFFVKGAGGKKYLPELQSAGANAVRTWSTDFATPVLDEAQKHGLKVCLGLWMKQERHGFDYTHRDAVDAQLIRLRAAVRRYRNHPALLMWCCGIEVEWGAGTNVAVYKAINDVARMVHEEDPHHPTTTAFADLGQNTVKAALAAQYCPELDIFGVNSYGGLNTMAERLGNVGWTRPYMIMEFGPQGQWEVPKTAWGAEVEQMPMDKAAFYLDAYNRSISSQENWCLGSFVFSWDYKMECTPTWYSMHLADGTRMNTADTMWRAWSRKEPTNRCPEIRWVGSSLNRSKVAPNKTFSLDVDATDPDQDPLTYQWTLMTEIKKKAPDQTVITELKPHAGRITGETSNKAKILTPTVAGAYRVFVYVYDGKGNASSANLPFYVETK